MDRERIAEAAAGVPGVLFATLFGSRAGDRARSDSDWDMGVYLDDALDARERSRIRLRLVAALEPAIHIDVVNLNEAPALLARRALRAEDVLEAGLAEQMQDWAGLRKVLAHLYLEVDHERLYEILRGELGQLERYAAALSREDSALADLASHTAFLTRAGAG